MYTPSEQYNDHGHSYQSLQSNLLDCTDIVHTSFRSFCTRSNPFTVSRWPGSK